MAMPTPSIAEGRLGSRMMMTAIASSTIGNENSTSLIHMTTRSTRPPRQPENRPTGTPSPTATAIAMTIEFTAKRAPCTTRL